MFQLEAQDTNVSEAQSPMAAGHPLCCQSLGFWISAGH